MRFCFLFSAFVLTASVKIRCLLCIDFYSPFLSFLSCLMRAKSIFLPFYSFLGSHVYPVENVKGQGVIFDGSWWHRPGGEEAEGGGGNI